MMIAIFGHPSIGMALVACGCSELDGTVDWRMCTSLVKALTELPTLPIIPSSSIREIPNFFGHALRCAGSERSTWLREHGRLGRRILAFQQSFDSVRLCT